MRLLLGFIHVFQCIIYLKFMFIFIRYSASYWLNNKNTGNFLYFIQLKHARAHIPFIITSLIKPSNIKFKKILNQATKPPCWKIHTSARLPINLLKSLLILSNVSVYFWTTFWYYIWWNWEYAFQERLKSQVELLKF